MYALMRAAIIAFLKRGGSYSFGDLAWELSLDEKDCLNILRELREEGRLISHTNPACDPAYSWKRE